MAKRHYIGRSDAPAPAWLADADAALSKARDAADAAKSALVDAMISASHDVALMEIIGRRLDRLSGAMEGGAAYGPLASLARTEWTGGDSMESQNHIRYIEQL